MKFCTQPFFNAENPEITSNFIIADLLDSNFLYFRNFVPSSQLNPKIKFYIIFEFYISKSPANKKISKKHIQYISNEQKRFYLLDHFSYVCLFSVKNEIHWFCSTNISYFSTKKNPRVFQMFVSTYCCEIVLNNCLFCYRRSIPSTRIFFSGGSNTSVWFWSFTLQWKIISSPFKIVFLANTNVSIKFMEKSCALIIFFIAHLQSFDVFCGIFIFRLNSRLKCFVCKKSWKW